MVCHFDCLIIFSKVHTLEDDLHVDVRVDQPFEASTGFGGVQHSDFGAVDEPSCDLIQNSRGAIPRSTISSALA